MAERKQSVEACLRSLLVHMMRFLLLTLLSPQAHKPQCTSSCIETKRTVFARTLGSATWENGESSNPKFWGFFFCTTERTGKKTQGSSS